MTYIGTILIDKCFPRSSCGWPGIFYPIIPCDFPYLPVTFDIPLFFLFLRFFFFFFIPLFLWTILCYFCICLLLVQMSNEQNTSKQPLSSASFNTSGSRRQTSEISVAATAKISIGCFTQFHGQPTVIIKSNIKFECLVFNSENINS